MAGNLEVRYYRKSQQVDLLAVGLYWENHFMISTYVYFLSRKTTVGCGAISSAALMATTLSFSLVSRSFALNSSLYSSLLIFRIAKL